MQIKILGTGCYKCIQLETLVNSVLEELGKSNIRIERIADERTIRKYMPLDQIPGMIIDDVLVSTGELLPRETLVEWFSGIPVADEQGG